MINKTSASAVDHNTNRSVHRPHRLLVMAGGTGGHIIPGLAVADIMRRNGWKVMWLGNPDGMEARMVPVRGFDMLPVTFSGLRGKGVLRGILMPFSLLRACAQSWRAISEARPDVILGMGGYISFPGGLVAWLRRIPLVVHEQNAIPGWANKVLAICARRILTGFPGVFKRGEWVGNPVRAAIAQLPVPEERYAQRQGRLRILVLGGSLGAKALNEAIPAAMALTPEDRRPHIVHQAGDAHIADVQRRYENAGVQARCVPFIRDMASAYGWADLVISRAGASTVAELAAGGIPAVLVPFPHAVDDHQTANAHFLVHAGAAIVLPQEEIRPERLSQAAYIARGQLKSIAQCARRLGKADAAETVAKVCMEMVS
jgi:UDP-N-acetylglucosamine--N-acetylmuramyl-(pentapeptide) pyrophosphoryl-undecaprenol N-acetylglucosamine transferase